MKKAASYSILLLVAIFSVLPLWGKDIYLVFPFEDKTEQNLSEEARSAFNIALFATGKGDVVPYYLRSPMVKRLITDGSLKEEEVTSVPSDDRAIEIGKLFGANYVFLGSVEELKEEEGAISVMERARMLSVVEGKQVKEAVVTGKSRGKVNGVSREAAIKEALDDAARSLVAALVGPAKPSEKPAEIKRKERSNYYLLGAVLLGWVIWNQTREKEKAEVYALRVDAVSYGATVDLNWTSTGPSTSKYKIYRATMQNTPQGAPWNIQVIKDVKTLPYEELWEVYPPQTNYTDVDVRVGNAYSYCVVAIGKSGEEIGRAYSRLVIVGAPLVPTGVSAIKIASKTQSYVEIEWQAVVGASSYRIYRGVSPDGPFVLIDSVEGTQYLDVNPPAGASYYRVSALSAQGAEGLASTPIQPTPEAPAPTPP